MEQFYKKIRIRSDEKPRLMTGIVALFYFVMGMGNADVFQRGILPIIISTVFCVYMATLVYAIVKGNIGKAICNCALFFAVGILAQLRFFNTNIPYNIAGYGALLFVIALCIGLGLGYIMYGKYIKNEK